MTRKRKSPIGLFDIPVQVPCPDCGNKAPVPLGRFKEGPLNVICRTCPREFQVSEEERSRLFNEHGKYLDALRRSLGKRDGV